MMEIKKSSTTPEGVSAAFGDYDEKAGFPEATLTVGEDGKIRITRSDKS